MNVLDLLSSLRKANIQISLVDDKLKIKAPKGAVTPEIKQQLSEAKQEIIDFLREAAAPVKVATSIPVVDRGGDLPLSYTQAALWTLDRMSPGSIAYNLPMAFKFFGGLDSSILERAIQAVIQRHESLRLVVAENDAGEPVAVFAEAGHYQLPVHELVLDQHSDYESEVKSCVDHYALKPFDLGSGPLYRFDLVRISGDVSEQHDLLVVCLHHIISDGLSQNLLVREIAMLYAAYVQGAPSPLPDLPIQYADYAAWQRSLLTGEKLDQEIAFWKTQLRGVPSLLALPTDRPRPLIQTSNGARYHFSIPLQTSTAVIRFAQEQGYTVFMGLMAALQMVLSRHARQTDFCIGMPTAGRHLQEVENLIGFFVNGVLVRADLKGNLTWKDHLNNVKQRLMDVLSHQETPAQLIIDHLDVPRNPSYPPLAQVGFQLQNFSGSVQSGNDESAMLDAFRKMTNLSMEPVPLEEADSKFDMIVSVTQQDTQLNGYVEYNTDLFDEETVARLMSHFNRAIDSLVTESDQKLNTIELDSLSSLADELGVAPGEHICRLTTTQMAFVQDIELRPETRQYAVGFRYLIPKQVDHAALEKAINHVIHGHQVLKARFVRCDLPWADSAYQIFREHYWVPLEYIDIGVRDDAESFVESHFDKWCYRTHDIFNDDLIRFQLIVSGNQSWLLLSCHHIILDGMSGMAMLRKLILCYENELSGKPLPIFADNFSNYVASHHESVDADQAVAFWQERNVAVAPLVFSNPGTWPAKRDYQIISHPIDDALLSDINSYCRKQKTHPSILYRLVSALMIREYCRPEADFVLWDIQSGRTVAEEASIGVFYQQVPYIIPLELLSGQNKAADFFGQQRRYRREIKDCTYLSLAKLNQLFAAGSLSFQYNYFNFLEPVEFDGVSSLPYTFSSHVDNTVQVFVKDYGDSLEFELWFDGSVFVPLEFLARMEQLTRQLIVDVDVPLSDVRFDLLDERRKVSQWNDNQQSLEYDNIVAWYQHSVAAHSDQIALIYDDVELTYAQLDQRVNQLANHLCERGVNTCDRVGVFLSRSEWSVISVLAVLKTGATYIPIEPSYPCERVEFILADSQARLLITESCLNGKTAGYTGEYVVLDEIGNTLCTCIDTFELPDIKSQDPIYAIYTSGSTGKPKGALVAHGGEVNLQHWYTSLCDFDCNDRTLILSAFGFDLTQKNLFAPLLCGGAVVIPKMDEFDANVVAAEINRFGITHINCAPSALYSIVEDCDQARSVELRTLRWVFLGGEPIRLSALHQWLQFSSTIAQIVNSYGPTECTDVVSYHVLQNIASENTLIPIGKPICNTELYILDDSHLPAPFGVVGEICIGGVGVGKGYIGREDLNSEVFIQTPATGGIIYKTGDLGRYFPDGSIEYIGRKDFQVKVRGLRIELGEVETAIKSLPEIADAVVLVKDDSLVGYALNPKGIVAQDWQVQLRNKLPDYMVPAHLIALEQWPLTPNGKIDRKALPEPASSDLVTEYVAPRNELESSIAEIWAQVLKLDRVGIEDSFFDLGGHSLLANQIVSRIRKLYKIELPIRDLMLYPSVAQLAQRVLKAQRSEQLGEITPVSRDARIPLSASQQRLWLLDRIEPGNAAYHVPTVVTVKGPIQVDLIQSAFSAVINRNEGLRAVFLEDESGPYHAFLPSSEWQLQIIDATDSNADALERLVASLVLKPFSLDQGPLFRGAVLKRGEEEHLLVVVLHHIITDGWSNGLLVRQLGETYITLLTRNKVEAPAATLQYADFAAWQHQFLSETMSKKMAFWRRELADVSALELPLDFKRPSVQTFAGANVNLELSPSVSKAMNELANRYQVTPFMVFLAAYGALLQRYSGQERFAIGTPVAGRDRPELEEVVGFFVNTVAVPLAPEPQHSFSELLEHAKEQALNCFEHQDIPFEQIVEELNPVRDMSRSPVFQVMLAYQDLAMNDAPDQAAQLGNLVLEPYELELNTAKFEQTLTLWPTPSGISGSLSFNTDLFSRESAQQFVAHFTRFCELAFFHPELPLHQIDVLSDQERQQQLYDWNASHRDYRVERVENLVVGAQESISGVLEQVAVSQGDQLLTYAELHSNSDVIAAKLLSCGIQRSESVGVVLDRNIQLMSVILGVLKTGAVYVPIDAAYPEERIRYICEQSGIHTLLTLSHLVENLPHELQILDLVDLETWRTQSTTITPIEYREDDLIYVIYTSGSTGKPKGTGAYHRSEANLLAWYTDQFHMTAGDRVLLLSAIGFDLTQKNLFAPLTCGARLVIPEFQEYDPAKIVDVIEREEITWINCAPSAFYPLIDNVDDWGRLKSLRYVFLGGEPINMSRLDGWLSKTDCQLINSYGPTECADIASWHRIDPKTDSKKAAIPIGRPNYNVQLYILGEHQELLPRGAIGELCIGGDGVGPGYLNQPELTDAVFVRNPFNPDDKIYRTGDRVRYQADGAVVYLGRRDHQIKLRGYRVEAGEIQSVINRHEAVKESLVDVLKNPAGVDQLVVWVATDPLSAPVNELAQADLINDLKVLARNNLPSFMIPDSWVALESFKLTANGKIDRKALPKPNWSERGENYVAPRNEMEVALAEIWSQVLHVDRVGVHDNFFELGGHSLLATQVASRVRSNLNLSLQIRVLMSHPTIGELAPQLAALQAGADELPLFEVDRNERIPLSFAQQRLWLLDKIDGESLAYTVPSIIRIRGRLKPAVLESALASVLNRHEGLRTVFGEDEDGPYQVILEQSAWPLPLVDVTAEADSNDFEAVLAECKRLMAIELMTPFDLSAGPLFRNKLFKLGDGDYVFLVAIHHIVTDGWSMNVLIQDLAQAYVQIDLHDEVFFKKLPFQYADFSVWQRNRLDRSEQVRLLDYWKRQLDGVEPLNLPLDFQRPPVQRFNGNTVRFDVSKAVRDGLHKQAISQNTSLFVALMSGFFILLRQYSGQNNFCIGTPVAGRERAELENVVGFFVNTLAIRAEVSGRNCFSDVLDQVKKSVIDGLAHQEMPFEQIVEEVDPSRDMSRTPLFQVMLAYQNLPQEQQAITGSETLGDIQLAPFDPGVDSSKYELTMTLWESGEGLGGSLQYNTDLFSQSTIERMVGHYVALLEQVVPHPLMPLHQLAFLSKEEREQQLIEWNLTDYPYDRELTLDQALSASLQRYASNTAIRCGIASLNYAQLDQYSNKVAALLQSKGIRSGDKVAFCLDRNLHLMTVLLGIIKAGATYVPLDASYPKQRLSYILHHADARLVLTQEHLQSALPDSDHVLVWENILSELDTLSDTVTPVQVLPDQLLYVIFTSGSTGNPKGTGAFHRSEINLMNWYTGEFNMVEADRLLLLSAVGFDLTQKNLFAPLLTGACLIIPDFNEFDAQKINHLIEDEKVTWLNCAPSAFYALQDEPADWQKLGSLRLLFLGGEPINVPRIADWLKHSRCQLINSYGPTECADIAAWYPVDVYRDYNAPALPIGRPNYNVQLFVLGDEQELLPTGAIGELYIAGDGVGPGYINNDEQTQSAFLPNPYAQQGNFYKTGDRVRYRTDGNVEYLGRKDHQIKLRGYRIEAGEIQSVINHVDAVKDSLVDVVKDGNGVQRLVAWVVTAEEQQDFTAMLKQACHDKLPAFMVPEHWLLLPSFPLTPNGKVDRKVLPQPEVQSDHEYVAPQSEKEIALCQLWQSVLGVEQVGVTDNFFNLGGQSLLATRLVSRMSRILGTSVQVRHLFENPTIRSLFRYIEHHASISDRPAITKRPEHSYAPLSFGQQRLWFFEQMNPGTQANNMPVAVRIKGHLDYPVLNKAFKELIRRHESLRCRFATDDSGTPYQWIQDNVEFELETIDLTQLDQAARDVELEAMLQANSQTPVSLLQAPLLRSQVVRTSVEPQEQTLMLCMHHIISDGASQVVLFRELMTLYITNLTGQPSPLPELKIHYPDFAYWQRQWLGEDSLGQQLNYWKQQLQGAPALLDLPLDKPRPKVQTTRGATENAVFPEELTLKLRRVCEEQGVTPFMATLLAWQILLHRISGQADILVGVPTLGRHTPELDNVIGFFIQSLVLRSRFERNPLLQDALAETKKTVLEGFSNGDVPVDKIVEHLGVARNPAYSPLVQVAFQLLDSAGFNAAQLADQAKIGDLEVEVVGSETASAKFDLTLNLTLDSDQLAASLEYNTDLFLPSTARMFLDGFQRVCEQLVDDLSRPVASLAIIGEDQLLEELGLDSGLVESVQPLSSMQYDMFMDNLVNPGSLQSSHGWNIHIHRALDLELWHRALQSIVKQQPMLRARFVAAEKASLDMGYLVVARESMPDVVLIDKTAAELSESGLEQLINSLIYKPYDILNDDLVTYYVVKLAPDHFVVVTAVHHAILDGASLNVLWLQWTEAYDSLLHDDKSEFEVVPFSDFAHIDRRTMDTAPVLGFWQEKLRSVEPLSFSVPSPVPEPTHFITKELLLDDDHWNSVKAFCRKQRITPSLYFKCLFGYVVQQCCRADTDFSIQETMGGRIKGHHYALGCYIQEIPFVFNRESLASDQRFIDVLEYARHFQKSIKDYRLISIGKQLELSPKGRIGFMYNFYQFLAQSDFLGESFSPEGTPSDPANNVQFVVTEVAGQLKLNLFYHGHLFSDFGMLQRIAGLSMQVLKTPTLKLHEFDLVTDPAEKLLLLEDWNNTQRDFDLTLCLHQKFELQVECNAAAIAISDDHNTLTYGELNQRANQLAHYLIEHGVQENDLVGLCAERSCAFLVGILGIMKAGGAYVPMDPKYPDDRIEYMVQNSAVCVLITQQHLLDKTEAVAEGVHRLCLDRDWGQIETGSRNNPNIPSSSRNRAYMIYTSGSTGLPKGAIVRHDGALNHIEAECEVLAFDGAFSFLQTAPSSSDISVWQFIGPVTRGGRVVVLDDVTHSSKLFDLVKRHQIDVVELVPVALQLLMEYVRRLPEVDRSLPHLRWMMATGEAVSVELVNDWLTLYPEIPVVNAYGPTEAADDVIQCSIHHPLPLTQKSVPIGTPLANLSVYIVDDLLRLVPPGVPGEICIGGIGVGEGYWQNPEKTASAFVPDQFSQRTGATLYRTGDLGRWLSDGSVEYLDRVDNQVKVRGFRIELGEVEAALSGLQGVRENVVIVRDDLPGGKSLAAYVVAAQDELSGGDLDPQQLRAQLRESLPDFMVPAAITVMEALPLTPAGKVDRKALPRPVALQLGGSEYVAPRNDIEAKLVEIWESLMPVERIGVTDNFFELGGHSLVGVRIIAKVNKVFDQNMQVAALLTTQTIENLANLIVGGQSTDTLVVPIAQSENPPLFMIHPVGGDVLCYADLGRALQSQYSVYGIRAKGLDGSRDPVLSLEEMIAEYVEGILQVQPQGPYLLLGQSLGGILGWAVAARLEALGHKVAHLVMLDTFSPQYLQSTHESDLGILSKALGVTLGLVSEENPQKTEAYLDRIYTSGVQSGVVPAEMDQAQFEALYKVSLQNHTIASQYKVENISATVHHFTAADNVSGGHSGDSWKGVIPTLVSHEVAGGHESMMQGELAPGLALMIQSRLQLDNNNKE